MLKKHLSIFFVATAILGICSCTDDDLKNAAAISSKKITLTKDRTYGMDVIYSDSAVVKAKGYAPIYDKVTPAQGTQYNEMPKGVKIEFYDAYLQVTGTITSDYAINDETKQTTIFRKNVVVVNDRMTFTTEELTWDETKKLYSSPYGTVVTKTGDVLTGSAFSAPQDFSTYKINTASGSGYIKGEIKP
jgi:hypothetical protein